ncbi:hypothetical protein [Paludisphaera soli]|uniref:hypothetical protein n=1 Tax=Paludisphaera soli TaxID=2712865 RepID=UPI0013ED2E5B|nr:hypothetical protein [Paludisphaera soli]
MEPFGEWATSRWSRLPALIATLCLAGAVILALSQSQRRELLAFDRRQAEPGPLAAEMERDRERRDAERRLHGELLDKLEQILTRLPAVR